MTSIKEWLEWAYGTVAQWLEHKPRLDLPGGQELRWASKEQWPQVGQPLPSCVFLHHLPIPWESPAYGKAVSVATEAGTQSSGSKMDAFTVYLRSARFTKCIIYLQKNMQFKMYWYLQLTLNAFLRADWLLYVYTMKYYLAIEKNEILPFATAWMDLEFIMLSAVSQRKTNTIWFHYMWNLKNKMNKTETDSQIQRTDWWLSEGRRVGGLGTKAKGLLSTNW